MTNAPSAGTCFGRRWPHRRVGGRRAGARRADADGEAEHPVAGQRGQQPVPRLLRRHAGPHAEHRRARQARPAVPPRLQRRAGLRAVALRHPHGRAPGELRARQPHARGGALPAWIRTYPEYLREAGYYCTNNAKTDFNCDADAAKIFDESSAKAHYKNRPRGQAVLRDLQPREFARVVAAWARCAGAQRGARTRAGSRDRRRTRGACQAGGRARARVHARHAGRSRGPRQVLQRRSRMDGADRRQAEGTRGGGSRRGHHRLLLLRQRRRAAAQQALLLRRWAAVRDGVAFPPKWQHLAPAKMGTGDHDRRSASWTWRRRSCRSSATPIPSTHAGRGVCRAASRSRAAGTPSACATAWTSATTSCARRPTAGTTTSATTRRTAPSSTARISGRQRATRVGSESGAPGISTRCRRASSRDPGRSRSCYDLQSGSGPGARTSLASPRMRTACERCGRPWTTTWWRSTTTGSSPKGCPLEGYEPSRDKAAYPLPRLMELARKAVLARHEEPRRVHVVARRPATRWCVTGPRRGC